MPIRQEPCYFCGEMATIEFRENHVFCTMCSAIYTYAKVLEAKCEHIDDSVPLVLRYTWKEEYFDKPYIYASANIFFCSKCNSTLELDLPI